LLKEREKKDLGGVAEIYPDLLEIIDFAASNQQYFDADIDIHGNFQERAERIRRACNT
jgi:hypothetical protein